jgi:hypothetical protein
MTASPSTPTSRRVPARQRPTAALLTAAALFTAISVFDLVAHPAEQGALHTYKEYVLTATILPAVGAMMWVLSALHMRLGTHSGRLGRIALRIATIGLLGLAADSVLTLTSGSTETVGPLYPFAMLTLVIGITGLAIAWYRGGVLPRWCGPALAVGWFLGATPVLGSGGSFLILAAAFPTIAVGLRRQTAPAVAAPAQLDSAVAA